MIYHYNLPMTIEDVEQYIKMCRKLGVLQLTHGDLSITLGAEPLRAPVELPDDGVETEDDARWDASGMRPVDLRERRR